LAHEPDGSAVDRLATAGLEKAIVHDGIDIAVFGFAFARQALMLIVRFAAWA
jgi:hypothetical protein